MKLLLNIFLVFSFVVAFLAPLTLCAQLFDSPPLPSSENRPDRNFIANGVKNDQHFPPASGPNLPLANLDHLVEHQGTQLDLQADISSPEILPLPSVEENISENSDPQFEGLQVGEFLSTSGDFPALPPDPYKNRQDPILPLEDELRQHGGSYLYSPEDFQLNRPEEDSSEQNELLRLPEDWQQPQPFTLFSDFLGTGPIKTFPGLKWPGANGYIWEPRFVGHGSYELFGFALEENGQRQDVLGHQLVVELDLRLTGTERFHVQFRPLGRNNTGGSFYQFSSPEHYEDNSTGVPDRYWFEGELDSIFGSYLNPFSARDFHFSFGRFPYALHNSLLINADLIGAVVSKNNIYFGSLSNLNIQTFYGINDVNAFANADSKVYGLHGSADYYRMFFETTYAFLQHDFDSSRDAHFAGISGTRFFGTLTVASRAFIKWGDQAGIGNGQLFVLESNYHRQFEHGWAGIEHGVLFCNAFLATAGWSNLGGGNFNRLRTSFEVNPLIRISAGRVTGETSGVALGIQLFRHHEDESWIPEIAFEAPSGEPVWGFGLRYLRKTGRRTYFEALGVLNYSDDSQFYREGVFASHVIIF